MNDFQKDKWYDHIYEVSSFDDLPEQIKEDLLYWYNITSNDIDNNDKELLLDLYLEGKFKAWHCPECGERVCLGEPDSWVEFQGTMGPDYTSYFGDQKEFSPEYLEAMCDDCRSKP
jgi:hypothetical protein